MSARLGNIHYWLYNQIQIIDDRNRFLVNKFDEISEPSSPPLSDVEITEALGEQHIHPGLESLIIRTQSAEVSIVEELLTLTDFQAIKELYYAHGVKTAKAEEKSAETIEETINALKDILLERMPCDRLTRIEVEENQGKMIKDPKLHTEFWIDSEVPVEKMHALYSAWIQGALFIINPQIQYVREINADHYVDVIKVS